MNFFLNTLPSTRKLWKVGIQDNFRHSMILFLELVTSKFMAAVAVPQEDLYN